MHARPYHALCRTRRVTAPPRKLLRAVSLPFRPYRGASCAVSWRLQRRIAAVSRTVSQHKAAPPPRYKICIAAHLQQPGLPLVTIRLIVSRHTPQQPGHARESVARPARGPAVSWPISAVSQTLLGRIARPCCAPLLAYALACHDTIHCIVTQGWKMGSSPSNFPALFFFFHIIFFTFVPPTKRPPKKKKFSFSGRKK